MTIEQRIKLLIGEYVVANMALQFENEQLKVQVAAASKPEPEAEAPTSTEVQG